MCILQLPQHFFPYNGRTCVNICKNQNPEESSHRRDETFKIGKTSANKIHGKQLKVSLIYSVPGCANRGTLEQLKKNENQCATSKVETVHWTSSKKVFIYRIIATIRQPTNNIHPSRYRPRRGASRYISEKKDNRGNRNKRDDDVTRPRKHQLTQSTTCSTAV